LRGKRVEFGFGHGDASEMTRMLRSGALRRWGARWKIRGASDAKLAIRSRVEESSFVLEVLKSRVLSAGGKQMGY
jgi:hypothetical protein